LGKEHSYIGFETFYINHCKSIQAAEEPKVSPMFPDWRVLLSTDSDED